MRRVALVCVAICVCTLDLTVVGAAHATDPFAKVGTYAAQWLVFARDARSIGMGSTGTCDASGLGTGQYNPASMAFVNRTTLGGSYQDLGADITISEAVLSSPIPFQSDSTSSAWRFGGSLGYSHLGMDPQTERTVFLPEGTGRTFDASDWMLSGLGAASWTHGIATLSAGGASRFFKSNLANNSATTWMFDIGLLAAFPIEIGGGTVRPRVGYSWLNLDTGGSYDGREFSIMNEKRGGFGFDISTPPTLAWGKSVSAMSLSVDYDHIETETNTSRDYAAGFEFSIVQFMHLRYGVIADDYTTYGMGLGWDYGHTLFRLDYAHVDQRTGDFYGIDVNRDTFGALIGVRW